MHQRFDWLVRTFASVKRDDSAVQEVRLRRRQKQRQIGYLVRLTKPASGNARSLVVRARAGRPDRFAHGREDDRW